MTLSGQAEGMTKALERLGVISEVTAGHSCSVVCRCIVKKDPKPSRLCQAGLGFAGALLGRVCSFYHIVSIPTMLPSLQVFLYTRPFLWWIGKQSLQYREASHAALSLVLVHP